MPMLGTHNGQKKMAVQGYSDISALLTTFISVDRNAGDNSATSLGRNRWGALPTTRSFHYL